MKSSSNAAINDLSTNATFNAAAEIKELEKLIAETGALACSVRDNVFEIQKRIATIIVNTWDLVTVSNIIQKMLDNKCLRLYGKRILANLDFILGYYDKIQIEDSGKVTITPFNTEELAPRIVDITFIEKALILSWRNSPKVLGQALHGKHKQAKFYALLTKKSTEINEYPCSDWRIATPPSDPTEKILRDLRRKLSGYAEDKGKLSNGKHWSTIDQLLQRAHSLGIIDKYEANKPQDQRALANTSDHKGNPKIPTK